VHIIAGNADSIPAALSMLEQEGIATVANPDVSVRVYKTFGIDEARELATKAAMRPVASARRVFVFAMDAITIEAQNALLKTLEEAPGNALFVFLHPAPATLLSTVRSRAQISILHVGHPMSHIAVDAFLKATPAKRLDLLKPLLEKGDDDTRDLGAILNFLAALERALAPAVAKKESRESLRAVFRARAYIGDRGALVKPLLEQLALLV